nr:hypothetical protein BaRGS_013868 [Batillaria attramentaria]
MDTSIAGGRKEAVHFDKITSRIEKLCYGLHKDFVEPATITLKVINGLYPGVTTVELDNLAAETAATMTTKHPDYAILAARIAVSNLQKETKKVFSEVMTDLYNWVNPKTGKHSPMISKETYDIIIKHAERLNSAIVYDRDFGYNYFGFKTLERSYLLKIDGKDIFEFLDLRKNTGKEESRARDLFYALWIPDLFMQRVEQNGDWTLMCPHECPGLADVWGEEFEKLYEKYEKERRGRKTVKAQALWYAIIEAQTETGTPYMLYKDSCNRKSNQQNVGTIKCSNLCTEIVEYSSPDEVAVCNLASVALNMFVRPDRTYDFAKLRDVVKVMARRSNFRHRPIGLGVQGLADAFLLMRFPFDSPEAQQLNKEIFEHIYYAALEASCELAERDGPHGVRNSLLMAPMPTASTAQILGNNESIEPYTSNIYTRRVLSGEFQIVNHHLLKDLTELGLWNDEMKNKIIANGGSIQASVLGIPADLQQLYKTVWEISQKTVIKMAADRGAYIDQSQSLNIHIAQPNYGKLSSMHFYAWKMGLKTGMYYLRTKPAANAIQFTVDKTKLKQASATTPEKSSPPPAAGNQDRGDAEQEQERNMAAMVCSLANKDECLMCGS